MKKLSIGVLAVSLTVQSMLVAPMAYAQNEDVSVQVSVNQEELEKAKEIYQEMMQSEEAKLLFDGLDTYKDYYTIKDNTYTFKDGAENVIPKETYNLMSETFKSANEELSKTKPGTGGIIKPMYEDPGTDSKYYGYDKKTYVYSNADFRNVGDWLYLSDGDTRKVVEWLMVAGGIAWFTGKILSLFPFPLAKGLTHSSEVISFLCGLQASYIGNLNRGNGIYVNIRSTGITVGAR